MSGSTGLLIMAAAFGMVSCSQSIPEMKITTAPREALKLVKYPSKDAPVPEGFKENPFVETNPEIVPTAQENELGFIIFSRPVTETVYPQSIPLPDERISSLSAFGTPGEFEPVTFTLYPLKELQDIRVEASALSSGKNVIAPENIDTRLVVYRNINYPHYTTNGVYRRMPELLEKVTLNNAQAKECQRYWLKIKVPESAAPGLYSGTVNISYKGSEKALSVPVSFRVLSFKLLKDPDKHYTAYNYDVFRAYKKKPLKWQENAARNDYKAMVEYGFDTFPTIYLSYDGKTNSFFVDNGDFMIKQIMDAGMKGPVPAPGIGGFYYAQTKKTMGPHHKIDEMPPADFYVKLTEAVKNFEKVRKEKGWPEFIYVPLDEVDANSKEFGEKVYKAFKDAGVRTYATKDPISPDAGDYAANVDFWCSQPFSIPYEKAAFDKTHGYWCYPNHNSYEIKIPDVMCRGGRMTYGFGLWRSGYTLLIPWIWRSYVQDYLRVASSGGNFADEDGNIVPTPYWECFREGYDDLRYLYTLQTAIVQRENSKDAACLKLVKEGRALLQKIWDAINVQPKYLGNNVWNPEEFNIYRWQMAEMTENLLKYPASNKSPAPSVIVDTGKGAAASGDFLEEQARKGNTIIKDLGDEDFTSWNNSGTEGALSVTEKFKHSGNKSLLFDVTVDHKKDGGGENGKYPIGWPRFLISFPGKGLDLTEYNYISMWVLVDSERDEVADDFSPFYISITSSVRRNFFGKDIISQVEQREWTHILLPINEQISSKEDLDGWKHVSAIQFGISEGKYADGTNIRFYVDGISLIKLKNPTIFSIDAPSAVLLPAKTLALPCSLMGVDREKAKEYLLDINLLDSKGKSICNVSSGVARSLRAVMDVSALKTPGYYTLQADLKEKKSGKIFSSYKKELDVINSPVVAE
ncbi:MAG: hypothetical protein A2020_12420 [Lentisphaerae bacterium GWF2_45_14]|nr:MAG: hypothetical protein A2020_12420 [Lentisphaerae bacterium GWF2_45_14]